jgi:hypothetical protein
MRPETWMLRYLVLRFSAASFWKHSYACFEIIEDVASKFFLIIELFAWFIAFGA